MLFGVAAVAEHLAQASIPGFRFCRRNSYLKPEGTHSVATTAGARPLIQQMSCAARCWSEKGCARYS